MDGLNTDEDITGRDFSIVNKALAYAILAIERLPDKWQEASDAADMRKLLEARVGKDFADNFLFPMARGHLERRGVEGLNPDSEGYASALKVKDRNPDNVVPLP